MYTYDDLKLRDTVATLFKLAACGLMALAFQNPALALGLSDIIVYSSLGEPLKASITVLGAKDLSSASCLRLGENSDINHINFKLSPTTSDNTAKVSLSSNAALNEPIINLTVVAGCNTSISRNYVLLLDPPFSTPSYETNNIAAAPAAQQVNPITQLPATKRPSTTSSKSKTKKKTVNRNTRTQKSNKQQTPSTNTATTQKKTSIEAAPDKPTLSISSGSNPAAYTSSPKLRLDATLTLTPNSNLAPTLDESIMMEDELTVVKNRIAHLQKQITSLEQQNLKLSSDNKLKIKQLTKTQKLEARFRNLLLLLGLILLLLVAYLAFTWLRRKQLHNQTNSTQSLWVSSDKQTPAALINDADTSDTSNISEQDGESEASEKEEEDNEDESDLLPPLTESGSEAPIVVEDEKDFSVLDHADVFLFHGRPALAIQLLQNYVTEYPKKSVTTWLFLLDLLAKENLKDQYEEASADCKLHYNIHIRDFTQQESDATESLEDFPRLAQGLCEVWNTPSALTYLDDLIYNTRLKPRAGLPRNLIEELTLLKTIALENVEHIEAPRLDEKKAAEIQEKEALLEKRKAEKLAEIAKAEQEAKEKEKAEEKETSFEFTLIDK